jgi:hypothetical protein
MWASLTQTVFNSADHNKAYTKQIITVTTTEATLTGGELAISETMSDL